MIENTYKDNYIVSNENTTSKGSYQYSLEQFPKPFWLWTLYRNYVDPLPLTIILPMDPLSQAMDPRLGNTILVDARLSLHQNSSDSIEHQNTRI